VTTGSEPVRVPDEAIAWHDAEIGGFAADLPLWRELAGALPGPVLDVGAGTGRVALDLARAGHDVVAVEIEEALAHELERRAAELGVELPTLCADIREITLESLPARPALAIAPMNFLQMFDRPARREVIASASSLLSPRGTLAFAVVDESWLTDPSDDAAPVVPDVREIDGWVFSSEPLWMQVSDLTITVRRMRQRVSPDGELHRSVHDIVLHRVSPSEVEEVALELGLVSRGGRVVDGAPSEADSTVVILEAR
jgi:SAM-dependent methyltransferase